MAAEEDRQVLLYSYWRSSSAYRVRIALNLKGIDYRQSHVHLVKDGGEQNQPGYRDINPLGLVPALVHNGQTIVQSMAIIEYLEEVFTDKPLMPAGAVARARVRSIAQSICSEIQPLNNLAVLNFLKNRMLFQAGVELAPPTPIVCAPASATISLVLYPPLLKCSRISGPSMYWYTSYTHQTKVVFSSLKAPLISLILFITIKV